MSIDSTLSNRTITETQVSSRNRFVPTALPWLIAAAALVIYSMTLNPWVSASNIIQVGKLSGWTWQPDLSEPLYWLITYPFRWFPHSSIPIALNLLSMVCAVLTLALLARSVALLPHDRTHEQRLREHGEFSLLSIPFAWLPPILAAIVCGLQLTLRECHCRIGRDAQSPAFCLCYSLFAGIQDTRARILVNSRCPRLRSGNDQ